MQKEIKNRKKISKQMGLKNVNLEDIKEHYQYGNWKSFGSQCGCGGGSCGGSCHCGCKS